METKKIKGGIEYTYGENGQLVSRKGKTFLEVYSYSGWRTHCMRIKI